MGRVYAGTPDMLTISDQHAVCTRPQRDAIVDRPDDLALRPDGGAREQSKIAPVSYTHLTLPTIYSV